MAFDEQPPKKVDRTNRLEAFLLDPLKVMEPGDRGAGCRERTACSRALGQRIRLRRPTATKPSWAAEEVSGGGIEEGRGGGSGRVRTSELYFVARLLETSNLHNSAFVPPTETLDPSLGGSLRALPASTRYHHPWRSSNGSLGLKTSQESLETSTSGTLSLYFYLVIVGGGSGAECGPSPRRVR